VLGVSHKFLRQLLVQDLNEAMPLEDRTRLEHVLLPLALVYAPLHALRAKMAKLSLRCVGVCCSVLQFAAVCFGVLQCVTVCCSVLQYVAVCCSVLQCVAIVLQCVAMCCSSE